MRFQDTSQKGKAMKIHAPYTIDGHPVLGTYGSTDLESLELVNETGMNLVFGGLNLLNPDTPEGRFCHEHGIKVIYSLAGHVHGRPRLSDAITATQTEIPIAAGNPLPGPGLVQIEEELIRYREASPAALTGCARGAEGTEPGTHRGGIILSWPEPIAESVAEVKDSPNLFGYYVLDDTPGNALSALKVLYKIAKSVDENGHPVCGGFSGATTLHNFGPGVADVIMMYFYPFLRTGYERTMTSFDVQWMLTEARKQVPGVPFFGIYQAFWGGTWNQQHPLTAREIREQMEDFVRDGASGLVAFYVSSRGPGAELNGWNTQENLCKEIRDICGEIRTTGGLSVPREPDSMAKARIQPTGFWEHPHEVPGMVPAWHIIAPFDDKEGAMLEAMFPPDREIDLKAKYPGKGLMAEWLTHRTVAGSIGLLELYGDGEYLSNAVAYATCTVTSPRAQDVQMRFSSDDDAIVWFGDSKVWRHDGPRGVHLDSDIVPVTLPSGETHIRVKVYNRAGPWGFFMRFTDRSGKPLGGLQFSPMPDDT